LNANHSEGKSKAEKLAQEMVKLRDLQKRETENRNELSASEGSERASLQWSEQQGRKRAKAAEEAEAARRKEAASYSSPARKGPVGLSRDSDSDSSYKSSDGPAILRRSSSSDYD
jgi:polyhydroxyalkanoate synthesis regulator phasin